MGDISRFFRGWNSPPSPLLIIYSIDIQQQQMASALTTKGLQTVQNLTVRNNLAVQNQLQAKHLIADNVVQVNAAHRDYAQLVLGSASKIAGSAAIDSDVVLQDGIGDVDGVVLADGTTSASPIVSKAIGAGALESLMIDSSLLDPTNVLLNPFTGATLPSVPTPTWKSSVELAAIKTANAGFNATPLQNEMAKVVDAGTTTKIILANLPGNNVHLNPFVGVVAAAPTNWQTTVQLDALEDAVGSTFVASPLQRAVALIQDGTDTSNAVLTSLIDPTNVNLNPFVGANALPLPTPTWKTNAELDALEDADDNTFVASALQRNMATAIEDGISTLINIALLDPTDPLLNPFVGTAAPVASAVWKTSAELDALQSAATSTFVASILQRDMALAIAKIAASISKASLLDPTDAAVNPFVGVALPVTELTWKTNAELDALEAAIGGTVLAPVASTFKASALQRDMAVLLEQSIANMSTIAIPSAYLAPYGVWARDYMNLVITYRTRRAVVKTAHDAWVAGGKVGTEPTRTFTYPIVSQENLAAAQAAHTIELATWTTNGGGASGVPQPMTPTVLAKPADPRKSIIALIEDYEAKRALRLAYEAALATYNEAVAAKAQYDIDYQAWVDGGSQAGQEPAVVPAPGAAPTLVPAPVHPLDAGDYSYQFEAIDAAVRKTGTVFSFSADGTMKLIEPLVIHSGGLHRVSVYPKGAFVMQGRTRENKFIFSQVADAQMDELIDETNIGHLGDNRRVAIEAGPVISYVMAGPDELDLVPQMVFQNASEKWRVALVPDRTTYEDEFGNIVQGDGLLKLMIQRHLAVPKAVTYNDSTGTPITSNISWETVSSFVGNSGAVGVKPSSDPIGYKSS
jgi:hypothetical protein